MEKEMRTVLSLVCDIQRECHEQEINFQLPGTTTSSLYMSVFPDGIFIGYLYLINKGKERSCDIYLSFDRRHLEFVYDGLPDANYFCHIRDNSHLHDVIKAVRTALEFSI